VGRISVVDADGATRGSAPFDFPAGYHTQASTIFEALGFMSGHTAKHLLASLASLVLVMSIVAKSRADAGARA